ncbi:LysR family transcriptional regulator (plasmid) [Pseudoalteromonas xiamenensis]|uniref:LysR family transcriptional regulator n=1 Tax=Pseudoalteromonas xiamenensis TaxID=882626 RepID=UPI0027E4D28E|nr:LysR family transcriptional regulator [Pseudoalteromonas xiamenensis]WMN61892.1 LysR family transcriptional regulator [Pseudoalteromonas xiamenensis]
MDWLTAIKSFEILAQTGSFTKAADLLNISPSAMSKRIDWLEQQLGHTLLVRTTRHVSLTEQGALFLPRVKQWVADFDALLDEAQSSHLEPQGTLKIAATQAVGSTVLMPNIKTFLALYPKLTIHLNVLPPGAPPDLHHDLVITRYHEEFDSSSLVGRRLIDYQMQMFASPDYLKHHKRIVSLNDVSEHKMLLTNYYQKKGGLVLEDGRVFSFTNYNFVTDHLDAILKAAIQGMGIIFISPHYIEREIRLGLLVPVLPEIKSAKTQLMAYYPKTDFIPYKTKRFFEHLKQNLAKSPL